MTSHNRAAAALAAFITLSQPAHAGGYTVPVVEIIPPVEMPSGPSGSLPGWWLLGGVAALGVICLIVCGNDEYRDRPTESDDDDVIGDNPDVPALPTTPDLPDVTPVPVPGALIGAATGIAALGGVAIRRRRKQRS